MEINILPNYKLGIPQGKQRRRHGKLKNNKRLKGEMWLEEDKVHKDDDWLEFESNKTDDIFIQFLNFIQIIKE